MIKVTVRLENDFDSKYDEVEITKEELEQYACNKAKDQYVDNYYHRITAVDSNIEIKTRF